MMHKNVIFVISDWSSAMTNRKNCIPSICGGLNFICVLIVKKCQVVCFCIDIGKYNETLPNTKFSKSPVVSALLLDICY